MGSSRLMTLVTIAGLSLWPRAAGAQGAEVVADPPAEAAPAAGEEAVAPDLSVATIDQLVAQLADPSPSRRVEAVRELADRPDARATPHLVALLRTEPSAEIRGWALRALAAADDPIARNAVAEAARRDPDLRARALAAQLAGVGGAAAPSDQCAPCPPCAEGLVVLPGAGGAAGSPGDGSEPVPAFLRREMQRAASDYLQRPPGSDSSRSMLIFASVIDGIGIPLLVTGTFLPFLTFAGPFMAPAGLSDTAFLAGWQRSLSRIGVEVDAAPQAVSWVLTGLTFIGSWVGSHIQLEAMWGYGDVETLVGSVLIGVAAIAELANIFVRGIWWRRAITRAYREVVRAEFGPDAVPEPE